jgi:hypothetical protein
MGREAHVTYSVTFGRLAIKQKSLLPLLTSTRYYATFQMDLKALTSLFATTLSPDPNVRKAGELQIRKVYRRLSVWKVDDFNQYR